MMIEQQAGPSAAHDLARDIAELPYVATTVTLPDLHMKPGMEAPSSLVVATRGKIIPHLVSESINDGMGLIIFDADAADVSADELVGILSFMNQAGATSKIHQTEYSWTPELLEAACRRGAEPLLDHYGLPPQWLDNIEDRGKATQGDLTSDEFLRAVPRYLRSTKLTRSEIGLNFGGNHFLEVQVVDQVVDEAVAAGQGIAEGRLAVMYHLGPGPLGSMLSNLYAFRSKPQIHRKVGYAFFRQLLHASHGWDAYRQFAGFKNWMPIDAASEAGMAYANVLNVIKNYGFAYRMGTVRAIVDAVGSVLGTAPSDASLAVDLSHNMLQPEEIAGESLWVSRHNCCRPMPGDLGIVSGNHQAASCITISPPGSDQRVGGFDHGVGYLLEEAARAGQVVRDERNLQTDRFYMTRGSDGIHRQDTQSLLNRDVLDGAMSSLVAENFVRPVAYMRPLVTLKHKT